MSAAMVSALTSLPYEEIQWPEPGTGVAAPGQEVPVRFAPFVDQLHRLADLGPGWNSYQSKPVAPLALWTALRLLVALDWQGPLPSAVPTAPGGVQLEWGGDDQGVEVEVRRDGSLAALVDVDGQMEEYELSGPYDPRWAGILLWAEKLA